MLLSQYGCCRDYIMAVALFYKTKGIPMAMSTVGMPCLVGKIIGGLKLVGLIFSHSPIITKEKKNLKF